MAWLLTLYLIKKLWQQTEQTPEQEKISIPIGVWVWIISLAVIEIALIVGHVNFNRGLTLIIKRSVNAFARSWLLYALMPLIGCLNIRKELIYRAACILCIQSLVLVPFCYYAPQMGLDSVLYDSVLAKVGGVGDIYYRVRLYVPEGGLTRLVLFAPWAPILGLAGNLYFILASQESNKILKLLGMTGAASMAWSSGSRAAQICLIGMPILSWILVRISKPAVQFAVAFASVLAGFLGNQIINWAENFKAYFDSMRDTADESSLERKLLQRITRYHWWNDAPIWGHGAVRRGPALINFQTLGSHHTWNGLLYIHGIVGFVAFAFAFAWTAVELFIKAHYSKTARVGLSIILVIFFFTFVDTLGTPIYTFWPSLVILGIAFKEKLKIPFELEAEMNNHRATSEVAKVNY
ncbi:MAG: O-antigen ligase domain-containing protein [Coleofasciculaceae cyanobacterium]